MYIVAKDGTGDFETIQAAIDAIPENSREAVLLIKNGVYEERVIVWRDHVRLVGESAEDTIITWSANARELEAQGHEQGTFLSFTMIVTGQDVTVEKLTVRNDAGDGRQVGQAVAVYAAGDRGVWRDCRLIAHQDTLFCGPVKPAVVDSIAPYPCSAQQVPQVNEPAHTDGRQYFENCCIQGDVDFIFGSYRCWFERCTLFMDQRGGWYTAANTPEDQPFGFVFHQCTLTGSCDTGMAYLGRPWRKFARTVFLHCDMDAHVAPLGFIDWDEERMVTPLLGEYGTTGVRADQSMRHPRQKRLTDEEAAVITRDAVLNGWQPDRYLPTWYLCGDSTMADYGPDRWPMMGWGQKLQDLLPDSLVENRAVNGRSSKSFVDEGRLHAIDCCIRPGDTLVICFSHNDEKDDPLRHTTPEGTFPQYLQMYIDTARRHQAEPILATPIPRRNFSEEGRLLATHGAYPDAIRALAKAQQVRLVDLERAVSQLFNQEGPEKTKAIFCHVPAGSPNYPEGCADNSHLQEHGAAMVASVYYDLLHGKIKLHEEQPAASAAQDERLHDMIDREDAVYTPPKQ